MKHVILIFSIFFLLTSCSQKQFSFRKKIAADKTETLVLKPQQSDLYFVSNSAISTIEIPINCYQQPLLFVEQINALSNVNITALPSDTIKKQNRLDGTKLPGDTLKSNQTKTSSNNSNKDVYFDGLFGFKLALLSLVAAPAAFAALYFCILGLKSGKHKGFAIAGIVLSSVIIIVSMVVLVTFIREFNRSTWFK